VFHWGDMVSGLQVLEAEKTAAGKCYNFYTMKRTRLKVGGPAPDVILRDVEGRRVSLLEPCHQGRSSLLIFLRHLG